MHLSYKLLGSCKLVEIVNEHLTIFLSRAQQQEEDEEEDIFSRILRPLTKKHPTVSPAAAAPCQTSKVLAAPHCHA